MSVRQNPVAMLSLNRPLSGSDERWVVQLDEAEENPEQMGSTRSEIPLYEGAILRIGRANSNDIVVRSKLASRFHALVSVTRNGVVVCDLDSLNGSFVNGYRVESPQDISSGDTLRVGPVEFSVHMRLSRSEAKPAASDSSEVRPVEVILFLADMFSYKERLAASSQESLTAILRQWFGDLREAVVGNGGSIDRFLGDGVLAFWLAQQGELKTQLEKAYQAARQVQRNTQQLPLVPGFEDPWSCAITLISRPALLAKSSSEYPPSLILGGVMNEAFGINTLAKRSGIGLSCNAVVADVLGASVQLKSLPEQRSSAVLGEVISAFEVV